MAENFYDRNKKRLLDAFVGAQKKMDSVNLREVMAKAFTQQKSEEMNRAQQQRAQQQKDQQALSQKMIEARRVVDRQRAQQQQQVLQQRQKADQLQKYQAQQRSNQVRQQQQKQELYARKAQMDSSKKAANFESAYKNIKTDKDSKFAKNIAFENDPKELKSLNKERSYRKQAMESDTFKSMANRATKKAEANEFEGAKKLDSKMDRYLEIKSYQDYLKKEPQAKQSEKTEAVKRKSEWLPSKDGKIQFSVDGMAYKKKNDLGQTDYYRRNRSGDFEFDHVTTTSIRAEQQKTKMLGLKAMNEQNSRLEEARNNPDLRIAQSKDQAKTLQKIQQDERVRGGTEEQDARKAQAKLEKHRQKIGVGQDGKQDGKKDVKLADSSKNVEGEKQAKKNQDQSVMKTNDREQNKQQEPHLQDDRVDQKQRELKPDAPTNAASVKKTESPEKLQRDLAADKLPKIPPVQNPRWPNNQQLSKQDIAMHNKGKLQNGAEKEAPAPKEVKKPDQTPPQDTPSTGAPGQENNPTKRRGR